MYLYHLVLLNHKPRLISFANPKYLNENVTSTSNPYVNIANPIKINKLTTVYLKSIMGTYCGLCRSGVWIVCLRVIYSISFDFLCRVIPKPLYLLIFGLVLCTMRMKSNEFNHIVIWMKLNQLVVVEN